MSAKPRRRAGGRPRKEHIEASKRIADLYITKDGHAATPDPQTVRALMPAAPATVGYSEQMMDVIIAHVMAGKSVRSIAAMDGMPDFVTIYRWLEKNETNVERYKIATQHRARARVEEAERQADIMLLDDDFKRAGMYESRVRTLTRLAALGDPMRYSEKMLHMHHHTGELAVKLEFDLGQKLGEKPVIDAEDI
jgi:hypothetical protein